MAYAIMIGEGFPITTGSTPEAAVIDAARVPAPGIKPPSDGSSRSGLVNTYAAPPASWRTASVSFA
ncbi:hypothetical protein D3C85_1808390 [compost metagenome]